MNNMKTAVRRIAVVVLSAGLLMGVSGTAHAGKDTGWTKGDTGWTKSDSGWTKADSGWT